MRLYPLQLSCSNDGTQYPSLQSFWQCELLEGQHALIRSLTAISLQRKLQRVATATRSLIEVSLKGRSLQSVVMAGRRAGRSWQDIADEIRELTGVIVSRETVRGWFPDLRDTPKASA